MFTCGAIKVGEKGAVFSGQEQADTVQFCALEISSTQADLSSRCDWDDCVLHIQTCNVSPLEIAIPIFVLTPISPGLWEIPMQHFYRKTGTHIDRPCCLPLFDEEHYTLSVTSTSSKPIPVEVTVHYKTFLMHNRHPSPGFFRHLDYLPQHTESQLKKMLLMGFYIRLPPQPCRPPQDEAQQQSMVTSEPWGSLPKMELWINGIMAYSYTGKEMWIHGILHKRDWLFVPQDKCTHPDMWTWKSDFINAEKFTSTKLVTSSPVDLCLSYISVYE